MRRRSMSTSSTVTSAAGRTVLATIAVLALVAGAVATALAPATPAGAATPKTRVTVIGDSTLLGMRTDGANLIRARYDLNLQAASCRRLIEVSCDIPFRPTNTIDVMRAQAGRLGTALVIMAGYDDFEIDEGVDVIVAEARRQGVSRVIWLSYMEDVVYTGLGGQTFAEVFRSHNRVLRAKAAADPLLAVADWNAYADPHPEWFSSDGIHLSFAGSAALGDYIADQLDQFTVARCDPAAATGTPMPGGAPAVPSAAESGFSTLDPQRVLDTRLGAPIGAGRMITVDLGTRVPEDATAVAVNITAAPACATGYLVAFPCGGGQPLASNLNPVAGVVVAGFAIVPLTPGARTFCLSSLTQTDVVVDLMGYFHPGGSGWQPRSPIRLLDTRAAGSRRLAAGTAIPVQTATAPGFAAVLNLTMVEPGAPGFITVFRSASDGSCNPADRPLASAVNASAGAVVANFALVGPGSLGSVCIYTSVDTDLVVDETGSYVRGGGLLSALTPTRLVDTRSTGRTVGGATTLAVRLPGDGPAVLTVTAVDAFAPGFVTVWGADASGACPASARPLASVLNVSGPLAVPNLVFAGGSNGTVCLYANSPMHLVVDTVGRFGALLRPPG